MGASVLSVGILVGESVVGRGVGALVLSSSVGESVADDVGRGDGASVLSSSVGESVDDVVGGGDGALVLSSSLGESVDDVGESVVGSWVGNSVGE